MPGLTDTAPHPATVFAERGRTRQVDAHVTGCAFDRSGRLAAFVTGEGVLHRLDRQTGDWSDIPAHDGAILALVPDLTQGAFLTGGDDGAVNRIADAPTRLNSQGSRWIEALATHVDGKSGIIALAAGKRVTLLDPAGQILKTLEHPSTVAALAFDARGKRIAAAHYNGASLWFVASKSDTPRRLEWKGSHVALAIHPAGDALVTAMQENALHGWRLADDHHMRMSGYPTKPLSLSFTRTGKWLASSGAEAVVLWPFFAGGPMGKPPLELGAATGALCTRVACHPQSDMLAAGFSDGSVVIADIGSERILPISPPQTGPVSALTWSPDGAFLAFGTETGILAMIDLTRR